MNRKSVKTAKQTKTAADKSGSENMLANKLNDIAVLLDNEGLNFLIQQAETLLRNQQIEKTANKPAISSPNMAAKKAKAKQSNTIEIIEKEGSTSFILVIEKNRKFLTHDEMSSIVKVCYSASDDTDASKRLYTWLKKNRSDITYDVNIDSYQHPCLRMLFKEIVSRYTVKK